MSNVFVLRTDDWLPSKGGAHSFLRNKFINEDGKIDYRGWGFSDSGPPHEEPASLVKPKHQGMLSCVECSKSSATLKEGKGANKRGNMASDIEIWECITKILNSKPYKWYGYNCWSYAKEAARSCGLDCPQPPRLRK